MIFFMKRKEDSITREYSTIGEGAFDEIMYLVDIKTGEEISGKILFDGDNISFTNIMKYDFFYVVAIVPDNS